MIPHSYLVHFEFVQTCCLSSYAMHIPYFDHSWTRHQTLFVGHDNHTKPRHPPETKKKSRKWVIMLMVPRPKKNKRGKEGKMTRAKIWMMDKCLCLHLHMIKVFELHCYLETYCLNLQNKWKRWAHTSITIYRQERGFALRESYTMSARVNWAFKSLPHFQKYKNPPSSEKEGSHWFLVTCSEDQ